MISSETIHAVVAEYVGEVMGRLRCDEIYTQRVKEVMSHDLERILRRRAHRLSSPIAARRYIEKRFGSTAIVLGWLVGLWRRTSLFGYHAVILIVFIIPALILFDLGRLLAAILPVFFLHFLTRVVPQAITTLDDEGISIRQRFGRKKRFIPWSAIRSVEYEKTHVFGKSPIILRTDSAKPKVQLKGYNYTYGYLVSLIISKVGSTAQIDERFKSYLSRATVGWKGPMAAIELAEQALPFLLMPVIAFCVVYALTGAVVLPLVASWLLLLSQQSVLSELMPEEPQRTAAIVCLTGCLVGMFAVVSGAVAAREQLVLGGGAAAIYCAVLSRFVPPLGKFTWQQFGRRAITLGIVIAAVVGLWSSHAFPHRHILFRLPGSLQQVEGVDGGFLALLQSFDSEGKPSSHFVAFDPGRRGFRIQSWHEDIESYSVSPNGKQAIINVCGGSTAGLWILNLKDFSRQQIHKLQEHEGFYPLRILTQWAPDGGKAVLSCYVKGTHGFQRMLYDAKTGEIQLLFKGQNIGAPRFISPNKLLFLHTIKTQTKAPQKETIIEKVEVISCDLDADTTQTVRAFDGPFKSCTISLTMPWLVLRNTDDSLRFINVFSWDEKAFANKCLVEFNVFRVLGFPPRYFLGFSSFRDGSDGEDEALLSAARERGLLGHEYLVRFDLERGTEEVVLENSTGKILQLYASSNGDRVAYYKRLTESFSFLVPGVGLYAKDLPTGEVRRIHSELVGGFLRSIALTKLQGGLWSSDGNHLISTTMTIHSAGEHIKTAFWDIDVGGLFAGKH